MIHRPRPRRAALSVALLTALALTACSGSGKSSEASTTTMPATTMASTTTTAVTAAEHSSLDDAAALGKDSSLADWKFTVRTVTFKPQPALLTKAAEDGNKFVTVRLEVANIGDSAHTLNGLKVAAVSKSGARYEASDALAAGALDMTAEIPNGSTRAGEVAFEVADADVDQLTVILTIDGVDTYLAAYAP